MQIKYRKISELIPADYNPRDLTEEEFNDIKQSLKEFGFVDPVIVNTHPERLNIIVGGHQRTKVWASMGYESVPTSEVSLTLEKEKQLNIRLNRNSGHWDFDKLSINFELNDLMDWGFTPMDFEEVKMVSKKEKNEENYNSTYQLIFKTEDDKVKWLEFIKSLKSNYPDAETITERLLRFIEDNRMIEAK